MNDPIPTLVESVPAPVVETPTPVAPVVTETPATPTEPVVPVVTEPTTPQGETYELPDGRKVDAQTLQKEWKENFYPEYTRKSQKLSEYEKLTNPPQDQNVPAWKRSDYVPQTYAEMIEIARQEAIEAIKGEATQKEQALREVASQVDAKIAEIKAKDPGLDENALFQHAVKYGFRDLTQAHENMRYIKQIALDTEQRVLKNVTKRIDPVGGPTGGNSPSPTMTPTGHQQYGSALEFLQRIKGN